MAKEQFGHSYTFWTMAIMIFSPVSNLLHHPLAYIIIYSKVETITYVLYISSVVKTKMCRILFWHWKVEFCTCFDSGAYQNCSTLSLKICTVQVLVEKKVERNCHLIQFVSRLFIKSLVGDKLDFYLLTIWLCHHTHWSGVKYFLGENSILIHR